MEIKLNKNNDHDMASNEARKAIIIIVLVVVFGVIVSKLLMKILGCLMRSAIKGSKSWHFRAR